MSNLLKASTSKGSMLLAEIRRKYPNYHPIIAMVDIAHNSDASLELQYNCHKTVAKYIEPELKSIEVKGEMRELKTVKVSLFDEQKFIAEDVGFTEVPFAGEDSEVNQATSEY